MKISLIFIWVFDAEKEKKENNDHIKFTSSFIDVTVNCGLHLPLISVH